ncbi:MAG: rod shape-determining protein MreD [Clostridia bacterium]|jgi:rod shape-determining protein MreD|nr:rod shape-determining protein MreD [Clostridia bacterium]
MRISIIGILLLIVHAMSATLFQNLRIGEISPNFMIMIIVSFALLRGSKEGSLIGLTAGFLNDIIFGMGMGSTIVIYTLIGYVCGRFNKNFYRENFIIPFVCTLFSSLFYSVVSMLGFFLRGKVNFIFFLKTIIIPELIYTITLSLVIYQLTYLINEKIENTEKKTRNIF